MKKKKNRPGKSFCNFLKERTNTINTLLRSQQKIQKLFTRRMASKPKHEHYVSARMVRQENLHFLLSLRAEALCLTSHLQ